MSILDRLQALNLDAPKTEKYIWAANAYGPDHAFDDALDELVEIIEQAEAELADIHALAGRVRDECKEQLDQVHSNYMRQIRRVEKQRDDALRDLADFRAARNAWKGLATERDEALKACRHKDDLLKQMDAERDAAQEHLHDALAELSERDDAREQLGNALVELKQAEAELREVRQQLLDELAKNALTPTGMQRLEQAEAERDKLEWQAEYKLAEAKVVGMAQSDTIDEWEAMLRLAWEGEPGKDAPCCHESWHDWQVRLRQRVKEKP